MLYMGRRGNKAEVNDGGAIKRLPFSGTGQPPAQGTRVQPSTDGCCCPKTVKLEPPTNTENHNPTVRRTVSKNTPKQNKWICLPTYFVSYSKTVAGWNNLIAVLGDKNVLLYSVDSPSPWYGNYWVSYNFKRDKFSVILLQDKNSVIYFCDSTFGTSYAPSSNAPQNPDSQRENYLRYIYYLAKGYIPDLVISERDFIKPVNPNLGINNYVFDTYDPAPYLDYKDDRLDYPGHRWPLTHKEKSPYSHLYYGRYPFSVLTGSTEIVSLEEYGASVARWVKDPLKHKYERLY